MIILTATANQFLAHAIGDYLIQSHWMATEKVKSNLAAAIHALTYAIPFTFLCDASWIALAVIVLMHFAIDRWRLARYVVYGKNLIAPAVVWQPWESCQHTGYPDTVPQWLAVWLLIIADNVLHLITNAAAIQFL